MPGELGERRSELWAAVVETASGATGLSAERLRQRPGADLVAELGLDSLQLLEIWVALEGRFGLERGALGVTQAITLGAIAAELEQLAGPRPPSLPLGAEEIQRLLPHRPPILLLDRVVELEPGCRGVGEKDLAEGAPWFAGHFPGRPILPGVYLIEACAQLTAVVCRSGSPAGGEDRLAEGAPIDYLASVERFKFTSPVVPGETLVLESRIGRRSAGLLQARVGARVRERQVAEGTLIVTARG